ncbi:peptide ABC transporter substrate-binding protein [Thermoflavimicrobium daqui]|uniref:Peptide ABC transporter substrate-binding protein n=1 Tax=Thermoflavimicrobium daqui TaxID=2137476 RepID=A0A364K5T2_9BACL|nr:peptide ABC transporter substrate-binding protein [Thermoflavimicrobium daqui]RAL25628.1 peptide ABC transporter substrate-binding protein [Thermoflavimicrobium daqui]
MKWRMILAYMLIFSLVGCSGLKSGVTEKKGMSKDQVLNLSLFGKVTQLDTMDLTSGSLIILNNVMEGLLRLDKNNQAENAIAEEKTISSDKKTYVFKLRKDAKWSDGKPITAQDFEYAWKRALYPKLKGNAASLFYSIKNAKKYHNGNATEKDVAVKAIDPQTLEVQLEYPDPNFLDKLASPAFAPVRKDIVKKHGLNFGKHANTVLFNGPFIVSEWNPSKIVLKKNEQYWDRNMVSLEKIEFSLLSNPKKEIDLYMAGKLDIVPLQHFTEAYRNSPDFLEVEDATTVFINFNQNNPFFANANIRKAVAMAIDRKYITDGVLKNGAKPAASFVPPVIHVNGKPFNTMSKSSLKNNQQMAHTYLQKGLKELKLSQPPVIKMVTSSIEGVAVELKQQLKRNLGLDVQLVTATTYEEYSTQNADMEIWEWKATYNDPMSFLEIFSSKSKANAFHFHNKEYDSLMDKLQLLSDSQQRQSTMIQAEKLLVDQLSAIVPLYYEGSTFLQKKYVKDLQRHPYIADLSFKWTYISDEKDN